MERKDASRTVSRFNPKASTRKPKTKSKARNDTDSRSLVRPSGARSQVQKNRTNELATQSSLFYNNDQHKNPSKGSAKDKLKLRKPKSKKSDVSKKPSEKTCNTGLEGGEADVEDNS